MRQIAFIAAVFTLVIGSLAAADTQLMGLVMPDAKVMCGINLDQAKTSPFAQYVLAHIAATPDQQFQQLVDSTGFDPRRDVSEILFATSADPANPSSVLLARGTFNLTQIKAAAQTHGAIISDYKGATLFTHPPNPAEAHPHAMGAAFLNGTLAIAGDLNSV